MGVLEDEQARDQPCRQWRLTWARFTDRGKALFQEAPVDLLCQPHQRVAHIDDLIQRRPEQVLLPLVARLRHRLSPSHHYPLRESRSDQNRNPKSQESRAKIPLSCKIHYSSSRTALSPTERSGYFTADS